MLLAQPDIVQSKACLKSEYLSAFVFKQNAALGYIWLSPNGLLAGHFGSNEVYDYL